MPTAANTRWTSMVFTCGAATPCPNPVEPFFSRLMTALESSSTSAGFTAPLRASESTSSRIASSRLVALSGAMIAFSTTMSRSFM